MSEFSSGSNDHISFSLFLTQLLSPFFFMQESKMNSHTRKRWYERAIEATMLWKYSLSKPIDLPMKSMITPWKTNNSRKLRKCTSTRVASSFTHVCLCAPISSYTDIFEGPPRRSFSYQRSRSTTTTTTTTTRHEIRGGGPNSARMSVEGRKIFRGKSLTDDVLMRRFVIDEEATMQVMRRRNEMEIIRRRSGMRKPKIGPSPLSRMVLAKEE